MNSDNYSSKIGGIRMLVICSSYFEVVRSVPQFGPPVYVVSSISVIYAYISHRESLSFHTPFSSAFRSFGSSRDWTSTTKETFETTLTGCVQQILSLDMFLHTRTFPISDKNPSFLLLYIGSLLSSL